MRFRDTGAALLVTICLSTPGWGAERSGNETKADSIRFLQDLRTENVKRLKDIDQTLSRTIEEGGSVPNLEKEVSSLKAEQKEHILRQEFLDRLIFQIDTKFRGGDLRAFLERALTEMAKIDAVQTSADSGLWKFMKYAADAVKRLPEQKENILSFLEGYMRRSISNPVRPDEFLNARNYTNGAKSEQGTPVSREDVGAIADRRLHELDDSASTAELPRAR